MGAWGDGYVTDILYTHGYYSQLNPAMARFLLLASGYAVNPNDGEQCHCELGFGQGLSINIHAAASGDAWYGNDFNPAQVGHAQDLAAVSGANIHLYDDSFAQFLTRRDLPQFDSISLHGIWSWISEENKQIITEFIRQKLKPGGVVYVSYNTTPGWSGFLPIRNLLNQYSKLNCPSGTRIERNIDASLNYVEKLLKTSNFYTKIHPTIGKKFEKIMKSPREYLAHEYFNQSWTPVFFSELHAHFSQAKLNFACSATLNEHIDEINLSAEQIEILSQVENPVLYEDTRDLIVNQQFRRDYWIKGARKLSPSEQHRELRNQKLILKVKHEKIDLVVTGVLGKLKLDHRQFDRLLSVMPANEPISIGQIEDQLQQHSLSVQTISKMVIALMAMLVIAPVQEDSKFRRAIESSRKLNNFILEHAENVERSAYLTSPLLGGGVPLDRINLLFFIALQRGAGNVEELARFAMANMLENRQTILHNGEPLRDADRLQIVMHEKARSFIDDQIPMLRALAVL